MLKFFCLNTWNTCRKAKAWLSQRQAEFEYRNISKEPPTEDELRKIAKLGGYTIQQLVNTKGQTYRKLKPDLSTMEEGEIIAFIQANPSAMIRPILMDDKRLVKGFDEAAYEEFVQTNP